MKRIGRFEIQAEIGRGGFGRVYSAFDPTVGRIVAVKVLDSNGDASQLGRFRNEASAAGNLHHENIVTVHEFGEDDGTQYLVMEYLEGLDLQKVLKEVSLGTRTPLTILQKVSVMSQVAEGLHYAHSSGVLHRDVKPANIMLLADGGVKIMDFGIARLTRDNATRLTQQGYLIGTVLYMAPELLLGADVDALCDIWSYGVIFYEMLAGRNPFETGNLHSEMYKISHEDAPVLPADQCPAALQPVIRRLLARDRELRYQTLEDVRFDVEPVLLELKKEEADHLLPVAQDLCAREAWGEAQVLVRSILELEPQNRDARVLWERVQQGNRRRALKLRVDALAHRGSAEAEQRHFIEAIEIFESARKLDSDDEQVNARLKQLRQAKERNDRANQLLASAKQELGQNRLTSALERGSEALRADPEHPEAAELLSQIQREIEEREQERSIQAGLHTTRGLIAIESFDDAIALLNGLVAANPGRSDIQDLMARTVTQKSERNRRRRLEAGLESAKAFLKGSELPESIRVLEDLAQEFPSDPEVTDLLAYARQEQNTRQRIQAVEALSTQVSSLVQSHQFDDALAAIQNELRLYPDEMVLSRLLRSVLESQQAYEKQRGLEEGLRRIRELRQQGGWEDASQIVRSLLEETPADPELLTHDRELGEERQKHESAAAILRIAQNARLLISQNQPAEAVELLQTALRAYAGDPELAGALKRAEDALQEQENGKYVASQLFAAGELERRQEWDRALACVLEARERFPYRPDLVEAEERIRAAMADAERARKIAEEESSIQADLEAGNWSSAFARIEIGRETYPDQDLFRQLLEEGQRRRSDEINALVNEARQMLVAGQLDEAEKFLATHLVRYSGEPAVVAVADELEFERLRHEEVKRRDEEKKSYIATQLAAIAEFERNQDRHAALETVQSALQRYPNSSELSAAQQRIQAAVERLERNRRIAEEAAGIERMLAEGDWPGALERIELANLQDPDDPAYLRLWIEAHRHKTKELDALIAQGRQLFSAADLDGADVLLRARYEVFSREAEFKSLFEEITRERARRDEALRKDHERQEFISSELARSAELESRGEYSPAVELIRKALQRFPADALLLQELQRLENTWREFERARRMEDAVKAIQSELDKRKWDAALALIQRAQTDFAGESVFAELRQLAQDRRQGEIDDLVSRARTHLANGELDSAEALQKPLQPYAHEPSVVSLAKDVGAEKFCREREALARNQIAARRFTEAARAIQDLADRAPDRKVIPELQIALEEARQREQKERIYREGLAKAESLLRAGQFHDAIEQYTSLLGDFPGDVQLEKGLRKATEARDLERKKRLESEIGRLKKLRRRGAAEEVRSAALALLEKEENPRVRELLQWSEEARAAPPPDPGILSPDSLLARIRLRWVLIAVAGLGSVVAAWAIIAGLGPSPLKVDSTALTFTYDGAAVPPQSLLLTGGKRVPQLRSNAAWLTAVLESQGTPTRVKVQVDPKGLKADNYSGQLTIIAGSHASESRVVAVNLEVEPPIVENPPPPPSPLIKVAPLSVTFPSYQIGASPPTAQTISIISENPTNKVEFSVIPANSCSWLTLSAASGVTPTELKAMVNVAGLQGAREYTCTLSLRGKGASSSAPVAVSLNVTQPPLPPPQ